MVLFVCFIIILILGLSSKSIASESNNENVKVPELVVHIVGHTHDDPGWLITADQYYVKEVQWIFYTIIPILKQNKDRKFTYVEMAYMHRWWEEIDDDLKQDTIALVNNGQFQLNLGGWCMNDEANPTTSSIIHQMTDGNQFILNNFGSGVGRPKVAWHIDPFGHSWVTAGLWAQAGFDTFGLHRINYLDKLERKAARELEFIWNGSSSLGDNGLIFCHILDDGYSSPPLIQFWNGHQPWVQNDPLLPSWPPNIELLADDFVTEVRTRALTYKHNQLLMPFGSDFAHQNAYESYIQMDKLMDYINNNSTYNILVKYSTLWDYTLAVNQLNLTWKIEQPDFFIYLSSPHEYWTGYFTSRPILKLYVRSRENDLRVAEQYYLFAKNLKFNADYVNGMKNISFLREAIDVAQHHDAVTGTEKDAVAQEYMNQLKNGTIRMDDWAVSVVGQFLQKTHNSQIPELQRGGLSQLLPALTTNNYIVMVVYNSLAWTVTEYLQIPTNRSDLVVYDSNENIIPSQINQVTNQSELHEYPSKYTLFIYTKMKPLAFETMFIGADSSKAVIGKVTNMNTIKQNGPVTIGKGGYYSLTFDNITNRLSQIINNNISQSFNVENQFAQYQSSGGLYGDNLPNSGAYLFRPAQDNRYRLGLNDHHQRNITTNLVFRQPLPSTTPNFGFITTPHCGREVDPETFVTSICDININNNSFSFNYDVVNGVLDGWYQRPYIDWAVFDTNNDQYGHRLFEGTVTAMQMVPPPTSDRDDYVMISIDFSKNNFNSLPQLLLSTRKTNCYDEGRYIATITDVTTTKATIYVKRVEDGGSKWIDNIYIDYVVYDPSQRIMNGTRINKQVTISIPDDEKRIVHPFLIEMKNERDTFIPEEPVILLSIQQIDPVITSESNVRYYAYTSYITTNESFILNLYPFNGNDNNHNNNITLLITYWAFERNALHYDVAETSDAIINTLVEGPLISEMQQVFKSNYAQTFRVFNGMDDNDLAYIDNRVHIGPIDQGMEFITKYKTDLNNDYRFYTNQNGLEYVPRKYESWRDERIAGNYYPSTGQTYIKDINTDYKFSTIVNQGHGVGSYKLGEYEIMLQRRCLADDHKGVAEVLNTTSHTEPQIMILMDNKDNISNLNRKLYQIQQFSHTYFFSKTVITSIKDWVNSYNTSWTAMNDKYSDGLPEQVFLMQFRYAFSGHNQEINDGIILQLQNMFELNESPLSQNITIDLNNIISNNILYIKNSTEMTLTSNIPLKELHRLSWNIEDNNGNYVRTIRDKYSEEKRRKQQIKNDQNPVINIAPREIRTFVINNNNIQKKTVD